MIHKTINGEKKNQWLVFKVFDIYLLSKYKATAWSICIYFVHFFVFYLDSSYIPFFLLFIYIFLYTLYLYLLKITGKEQIKVSPNTYAHAAVPF